jgi:hypothetical protein
MWWMLWFLCILTVLVQIYVFLTFWFTATVSQDLGLFGSWFDFRGFSTAVFSFLVVTTSVGGEVFRQGFGRLLVGHVFGP